MKRIILLSAILSVFAFMQAQTVSFQHLVADYRQKSFVDAVPPGNYSGITPLGTNLYAVVDDKKGDGFCVFRILCDSVGEISSVENLGFRSSGQPNRDGEGIVYVPFTKSVFISGEADNKIFEYDLNGMQTNRSITMPEFFKKAKSNLGLEALAYNDHTRLIWTTSESPLTGDSVNILCCFDEALRLKETVEYTMDKPVSEDTTGIHVHGISEMLALKDGSLLILEREAHIPQEKLGARVNSKIYQFFPNHSYDKHLVHSWESYLSLFHQDFANYEGMCFGPELEDGSQVIILVSDSQNCYEGVLNDWFKTLVLK